MILSTYPQSRYVAPVLNAAQFTFSGRTFVAEMSDFRGTPYIGPLYDDACDLGLILENPDTGNGVPFVLSRVERDGDNEVIADHFDVCPEAVQRDAKLDGLRVVLFND